MYASGGGKEVKKINADDKLFQRKKKRKKNQTKQTRKGGKRRAKEST